MGKQARSGARGAGVAGTVAGSPPAYTMYRLLPYAGGGAPIQALPRLRHRLAGAVTWSAAAPPRPFFGSRIAAASAAVVASPPTASPTPTTTAAQPRRSLCRCATAATTGTMAAKKTDVIALFDVDGTLTKPRLVRWVGAWDRGVGRERFWCRQGGGAMGLARATRTASRGVWRQSGNAGRACSPVGAVGRAPSLREELRLTNARAAVTSCAGADGRCRPSCYHPL